MSATKAPSGPLSLWTATAPSGESFPELTGERTAEVIVVGGGYTGLSAALHMAEQGKDVALLEAAEPGWGASGRNGGQVIPGLKYDPDTLVEMFGPDLGPRVVKTVGAAADLVFTLIARHGIDCDARRPGWIQAAHSEKTLTTVHARALQWRRHGAEVELLDRAKVGALTGSSVFAGGWIDRRGGSIQPLGYARGLARAAAAAGARLFVESPALTVERDGEGWRVTTPKGSLKARQLVIGTNAYGNDLWPGLRQSVVPVFSFQVATAPLSETLRRSILPEGHSVSDTRNLLRYFRMDAAGRLVLGGRGPFTDTPEASDGAWQRDAVRAIYPQLDKVTYEYHWTGRVALTTDHLPHLHELAPGVHAGLGFNGRGVAMATMMGKLLAQRVCGAAAEEVDFPVLPLKPLPFHGFSRLAARLAVQYYRLRDMLDQ